MKNKFILSIVFAALMFAACEQSFFADAYTDPSKIAVSTVEKQFTGFLNANKWYVLPDYWNYFVVLRTSLQRYNQAVGWANGDNQYQPPTAGLGGRWDNFYGFLAQYRELEKIYNAQPTADQTDKRIYMIAATTYLYDHTQRVIDLHGDIPFSEAGKLSTNGGEYTKSYAKYEGAEVLYAKMLDDLKGYSDELANIKVSTGIAAGFKTQDFVNKGDLMAWRRYVNSLRIRMLTRVSSNGSLKGRAATEIAAILADATKYPIVSKNTENIQINVHDISSDIHAKNFRTGLEDWDGSLAGKVMIDHMKKNVDPRLRAVFEPGLKDSMKTYIGLDPMLDGAAQSALIAGGTIATYNRSTLSRNQFFPGIIINAAEVSFALAEYYLKASNDAAAKTAYEKGINESIEFYYDVRKVSNDNVSGALTAFTPAEVTAYLAAADISWTTAGANKLGLIANQKWIHFNVLQPVDNWSEMRRLGLPKLTFRDDPSNAQKQPPMRWFYPTSERTYNTANYNAVQSKDVLSQKLFWQP